MALAGHGHLSGVCQRWRLPPRPARRRVAPAGSPRGLLSSCRRRCVRASRRRLSRVDRCLDQWPDAALPHVFDACTLLLAVVCLLVCPGCGRWRRLLPVCRQLAGAASIGADSSSAAEAQPTHFLAHHGPPLYLLHPLWSLLTLGCPFPSLKAAAFSSGALICSVQLAPAQASYLPASAASPGLPRHPAAPGCPPGCPEVWQALQTVSQA